MDQSVQRWAEGRRSEGSIKAPVSQIDRRRAEAKLTENRYGVDQENGGTPLRL